MELIAYYFVKVSTVDFLLCLWDSLGTSWFIYLIGRRIEFLKMYLFDLIRGYKRWVGPAGGRTFIARLWQIVIQTGGRVTFRFPSDVGDDWYVYLICSLQHM